LPIEAVVICLNRTVSDGSMVDDCEMSINYTINSMNTAYLKVEYDENVEIRLE
jgi:hypothetical protein